MADTKNLNLNVGDEPFTTEYDVEVILYGGHDKSLKDVVPASSEADLQGFCKRIFMEGIARPINSDGWRELIPPGRIRKIRYRLKEGLKDEAISGDD